MNEPHYPINLYWSDEDGVWIAEVPDLRPCSSHGATREEALANIRDAIDGWLDVAKARGFPIPQPSFGPARNAA